MKKKHERGSRTSSKFFPGLGAISPCVRSRGAIVWLQFSGKTDKTIDKLVAYYRRSCASVLKEYIIRFPLGFNETAAPRATWSGARLLCYVQCVQCTVALRTPFKHRHGNTPYRRRPSRKNCTGVLCFCIFLGIRGTTSKLVTLVSSHGCCSARFVKKKGLLSVSSGDQSRVLCKRRGNHRLTTIHRVAIRSAVVSSRKLA